MKQYFSLVIICFFFILAGCAPGNIDRGYNLSSLNDKGLVLFTVTHDKVEGWGWNPRNGANIYSAVTFMNTTSKETRRAQSIDWGVPIMTSNIEGVWGQIYAWEVDAGHYELSD